MSTLVVTAHPNPDSFSAHLASRVVTGLTRVGEDHEIIDLYADGFDPVMSEREWKLHRSDAEDKDWLGRHAKALADAHAIVWVYPTWWSGPPAMMKGWVDRIWTNGVAYTHTDAGLEPGPLHHVRRMDVVTTHGASKLVNVLEGEAGKRMIRRGLRALCHPACRTRWIALYGVDRAARSRLEAFADRVERIYSAR